MMTVHPEGEASFRKKNYFIDQQIGKLVDEFQSPLISLARNYLLFHAFFICLALFEILSFVLFFSFLVEHALIAFVLSFVFLTCFSYFILNSYYQTQKPEQFKNLKNSLFLKAKTAFEYQEGSTDAHISMANAFYALAKSFEGAEGAFYRMPKFLSKLNPLVEGFSDWAHRHDVYVIKELLLLTAVEEQIKLVKCEPTSLEAHTALANGYVLLSSLYLNLEAHQKDENRRWKLFKTDFVGLNQKFQHAAESAIEEFKILCDYAPNDPWIHEQLAYSYSELQRPLEAIAEYELLLKIQPNDASSLFKLGVLYFQLGRNADGLRVYEQLRNVNYKQAEILVTHYGSCPINR